MNVPGTERERGDRDTVFRRRSVGQYQQGLFLLLFILLILPIFFILHILIILFILILLGLNPPLGAAVLRVEERNTLNECRRDNVNSALKTNLELCIPVLLCSSAMYSVLQNRPSVFSCTEVQCQNSTEVQCRLSTGVQSLRFLMFACSTNQ